MDPIDNLLQRIDEVIVNPLIYLLFAIALVVFLWGVVQFIINSDNEAGRTKGRQHILWGLIGMFIMVSAYGIINVIVHTFGIDSAPINNIKK
ncbi:MAG TPA: hypothetical protein VFA52_00890 [Candidatus Paceibacterota bacterium]|nr:hypothetical protein [Candidatus Paceibacterota bacterium]